MKIAKHNDRDYDDVVFKLSNRFTIENERVEKEVREILNDVRLSGDQGIYKYSMQFDNLDIFHSPLKVTEKEISAAVAEVSKDMLGSIEVAVERIRTFHEKQKQESWQYTDEDGITLGQLTRPLETVGLYVPGGKAIYPSSVLMNAIPAIVAGVERVIICTPARNGNIDPHILAAANFVGITEIYKIGGAQAVGAMAYGTKSIPKVDKIVGPGNIYVAIAKKLVYGVVDIDMVAGPSEILVVADEAANPAFVASDLLSQAEHDEDTFAVCVTISEQKAEDICDEVNKQMLKLKRPEIATASIRKNGVLLVEKDLDAAFEVANVVAPEHLELLIENPEEHLGKIKNAGAIFLGQYTPEPIGDFIAGPNHVLPTGGTARFKSPLGFDDFIKKTSLIHFSKEGFNKYANHALAFSEVENLEAHGKSVKIRMEYINSNDTDK